MSIVPQKGKFEKWAVRLAINELLVGLQCNIYSDKQSSVFLRLSRSENVSMSEQASILLITLFIGECFMLIFRAVKYVASVILGLQMLINTANINM